jgi:hypothetical protein
MDIDAEAVQVILDEFIIPIVTVVVLAAFKIFKLWRKAKAEKLV